MQETVSPPGVQPKEHAVADNRRSMLATYLLLMLLCVVPLLVLLSPYMVSLSVGAVLGALCHPIYTRLHRHVPSWIAAGTVTLAVVALVLAPTLALVLGVARQGSALVAQLAGGDTPTLAEIVAAVRRWVPFIDTFGTPEELLGQLKSGLASLWAAVSGVVLRRIQAFPQLVIQLILIVLSTYFALVNGRELFDWIGDKLPLSGEIRDRIGRAFLSATNAVVLASLAAAGAQATLIFVGFEVLGVPAPLLAAGLSLVLGWVPGLSTVVWGAAAIYLYAEGSLTKMFVMVGIGLCVGIIDNIVRTIVLRGQRAMNPMVSLLAILGGITFLGVPGVIIGPLIACMAIAVLEAWPAVASYCGIAVSGSGDLVPVVPMCMMDRPASPATEIPRRCGDADVV